MNEDEITPIGIHQIDDYDDTECNALSCRATWTPVLKNSIIDIMVETVRKTNRYEIGFKPVEWREMVGEFNRINRVNYSKVQITTTHTKKTY